MLALAHDVNASRVYVRARARHVEHDGRDARTEREACADKNSRRGFFVVPRYLELGQRLLNERRRRENREVRGETASDSPHQNKGGGSALAAIPCRGECPSGADVALDLMPGGIVFKGGKAGATWLARLLARLLGEKAGKVVLKFTASGLAHSFDRHAAQWFGRKVGAATHFQQWRALLERAGRSRLLYMSKVGETETIAQLARVEGKYIVLHYEAASGEFLTAFKPNQKQLTAAFEALSQ